VALFQHGVAAVSLAPHLVPRGGDIVAMNG
jgi:hypothetical protein